MQVVRDRGADSAAYDIADIARTHYDAVFRFCVRRIGPDRASDAAQETFLTAQKVLKKFRGESSLSTWLFGIANNECRRQIRMKGYEPQPIEFDPNKACGGDPERTLVDRETLRVAMAKLSPEHREAVLLHEIEGLTYEEA